jgi:hypothetical protein
VNSAPLTKGVTLATSARLGPGLREFSVCRVVGDCALVKIASFDQLSEAKTHMDTIGSQNSHGYIVFSEHNGKVLARFAKPNEKSESTSKARYKRNRSVENHGEGSPTLILREHVTHIKALEEYFLLMQKCYEQSKTVRESRDILAVCIDIIATASRIRQESDALRNFYPQPMARQFGTQL